MALVELLEKVDGPETFLEFVRMLRDDKIDELGKETDPYGPGANGWENGTIEAFLDAAVAWGESTHMGETHGMGNENIWKRCATFLYLGKIYE